MSETTPGQAQETLADAQRKAAENPVPVAAVAAFVASFLFGGLSRRR